MIRAWLSESALQVTHTRVAVADDVSAARLLAWLREEGCIAYSAAGVVEIVEPPAGAGGGRPGVDLVEAWSQRHPEAAVTFLAPAS